MRAIEHLIKVNTISFKDAIDLIEQDNARYLEREGTVLIVQDDTQYPEWSNKWEIVISLDLIEQFPVLAHLKL